MFDWLRGKADKTAPSSRLGALLRDYPPLTPPHRGTNGALPHSPGPLLTLSQCRENLHAQLEATPRRLELLADLLGSFGLATAAVQDERSREPFLRGLDAMLTAEMPALWRADLADQAGFELSDRAGERIVHSLIVDLSLLAGDMFVQGKPGCFWGINLDRRDQRMISYRRPCLLGLTDGLFPNIHHIYALEDEWFGVYRQMDVVYPGRFGGPFIGSWLLDRMQRDVVAADLAERRTKGWLKQAV